MVDNLDKAKRSKVMASIRSKNTLPELLLRRALFKRGLRYRIHVKKLPGTPDIVFASKRAVIRVEGCFWHGHNCKIARLPKTNVEFWREKINANVERDRRNLAMLEADGWRVCRVWECAFGAKRESEVSAVAATLIEWLNSSNKELSL